MIILSFESSCDETAAAVTQDGRQVLAQSVYSQIAMHAEYGGVVPELASRRHVEKLVAIANDAMTKANIGKDKLDAVAVTAAPGLIGAVLTGLSFAKSVAYALQIPLIPVHHIRGHIAANYIANPELRPPFVCLVASGGHTLFIAVDDYCSLRVLGTTRDDAAGEAFDKVARLMGYPYPGGRELDALARTAAPDADKKYRLPHPRFDDNALDCSFSGLKTFVINLVNNSRQRGEEPDMPALALAVNNTVADILVSRLLLAACQTGYKTVAIAGGVAANSFLRERVKYDGERAGLRVCLPPPSLCGDNGAMIGCAGYYEFLAGHTAGLDLNAYATMSADEPIPGAK